MFGEYVLLAHAPTCSACDVGTAEPEKDGERQSVRGQQQVRQDTLPGGSILAWWPRGGGGVRTSHDTRRRSLFDIPVSSIAALISLSSRAASHAGTSSAAGASRSAAW